MLFQHYISTVESEIAVYEAATAKNSLLDPSRSNTSRLNFSVVNREVLTCAPSSIKRKIKYFFFFFLCNLT